MSFNVKVKQGDEALGGLVEVHAALGSVDGDIRSSTGPGSETEARQSSQMFPGLAGDEDVLQLAQGSAETQLTYRIISLVKPGVTRSKTYWSVVVCPRHS